MIRKNIYIICAVRKANPERTEFLRKGVEALRQSGHTVFFPPDDAPQDDPTGRGIVATELQAIKDADEVHVIWDVDSRGSHFDLGIAVALNKKIVAITNEHAEPPGKSYWKAVLEWRPMDCRHCGQSESDCRANKFCEKSLDNKHDVGVHYWLNGVAQ